MTNTRFTLRVLVLLWVVSMFSAVGSAAPAPAAPRRGGIVRFGTALEPARLNPTLYPSPADRQVTELVYSRLVKPDRTMRLVNDLAERYEVSNDKLTITSASAAMPNGTMGHRSLLEM